MELNEQVVATAVAEAMVAARTATCDYLDANGHGLPFGLAWVGTRESGSSKVVRLLKKHGFMRSHGGGYVLWNPSGSSTQCMAALTSGAQAAANVLTAQLGYEFHMGNKID